MLWLAPKRTPMPYSRAKRPQRETAGHYYFKDYLSAGARAELLHFLTNIHPLWEYRYSSERPPPAGRSQRRLLRPVYWLGNWQFACLDYYRPPRGVADRCWHRAGAATTMHDDA